MFELPDLPYRYGALEPYIDEKTMRIHHDKHHAGYVKKLNAALEGKKELLSKDLTDILKDLDSLPEGVKMAVRNNGGGHANHTLFWEIMTPKGQGKPEGDLSKAIESTFGDIDTFKEKFTESALSRFGSGWAWLVLKNGKLEITTTPNQDSPQLEREIPLLGIDVWEHAYYLKYQNKRDEYITAWWNVVNWKKVSENFSKKDK